jgi:hypothetical protein
MCGCPDVDVHNAYLSSPGGHRDSPNSLAEKRAIRGSPNDGWDGQIPELTTSCREAGGQLKHVALVPAHCPSIYSALNQLSERCVGAFSYSIAACQVRVRGVF